MSILCIFNTKRGKKLDYSTFISLKTRKIIDYYINIHGIK